MEWNTEGESVLGTFTPTFAENSSSDMFMFLQNEGCRAPSVEIEQEQKAANALVELSKPCKLIDTLKFTASTLIFSDLIKLMRRVFPAQVAC